MEVGTRATQAAWPAARRFGGTSYAATTVGHPTYAPSSPDSLQRAATGRISASG